MHTATALWWVRPALLLALDEHLGPPVDSYVNGSQTWFTDEDETLEWRLHPVGGFALPRGLSHYDLWEQVVAQLSAGAGSRAEAGAEADGLLLGEESLALTRLWEGLECFPAHGDDLEPATLAHRATDRIRIPPDLTGLVDHEPIGDAWEHTRGSVSIVSMLAAQLST